MKNPLVPGRLERVLVGTNLKGTVLRVGGLLLATAAAFNSSPVNSLVHPSNALRQTPALEFYNPNAPAQKNSNTNSIAGMAIAAYLSGLRTGQTSENDVSNRGRNLRTSVMLSGGGVAILGVQSSSSQRAANGQRIPAAEDAYRVTVGENDTDGNSTVYTFIRKTDERYHARWDLSAVTTGPRSPVEHAVVVSTSAPGVADTVTSFNMYDNRIIGGSDIVHDSQVAANVFNLDAQRATCITDMAAQATSSIVYIN